MQVLLGGDSDRSVLLARQGYSVQRLETGQRSPGPGRPHQNCRLRHVQGGDYGRQDDQDVLRHTGLHSTGGEFSNEPYSNSCYVTTTLIMMWRGL